MVNQGSSEATVGQQHKVVIVGGGNAGISVAARLRKRLKGLDVAIIDDATKHYYQPLWTLVGGGVFAKEKSQRDQASVIPKGVPGPGDGDVARRERGRYRWWRTDRI